MSGTGESERPRINVREFRRLVVDIARERDRQLAKWGEQRHSDEWWYIILAEEFGEVARAMFEHEADDALEAEIVQVIAVAAAWLEDRRTRHETNKQDGIRYV